MFAQGACLVAGGVQRLCEPAWTAVADGPMELAGVHGNLQDPEEAPQAHRPACHVTPAAESPGPALLLH